MGNIVTNPKAFYITKKPQYEYIMKKGFSAAFANADATPKFKGVPFALTDAREQLGRYGDCVIPVTLEGAYEVVRMQNGIDYVFVPLDSADKIHIDAPQKSVRLSESKLRKIVSESVKKVLSERYLEPGTSDYETDKIARELKRFYPQYEEFVDEYVYGGYYERFANRVNPDINGGFREFVKSKQGKPRNNQPDRETIERVAELIDFLDNSKRGYHVEENHSIEELHDILTNWFYTYNQQGEMNSAIGGR